MSKEKGSLSIHSENIFPIIKKWLYSDHDIYIRELISNACDAITKVKRLSTFGEADLKDNTDFKVQVQLDTEAKTLKFIDNGIGMTDEEVKKYINQIAFSGAEDFLNTYKDKGDQDQIIGHFGLGFYSAFMVAKTVEINTLSFKEGAEPVKWLCDGGTEFEMEVGTKQERGTEIILYLGEDGEDFNNEFKVRSTIEKYCSFMPYPITFEWMNKEPQKDEEGNILVEEPKVLNTTTPLYAKNPSDCTDEEYKEFYRKTFMDFKEPLFWIHLNMDYPFNLKGILYFPKLGNELNTLEGQIKLYNSQVFVADNIKEVIPEFLLLLKGVIDCPDLPLNVSRSFLQNDGFVKKISDYITKKVADKLNGLYNTERESYENFWDDLSPFIKFGALKDPKFSEKIEKITLFKTTAGDYVTLPDYLERYKAHIENQVYYTTDEVQQTQYINLLKSHDVDAVILEHPIDNAFISHLEAQNEGVSFKRVDADVSDLMKEQEEESEDTEAKKAFVDQLTERFKSVLNLEHLTVQLETLKNKDVAGMIVLSESNRRMQEMMKMYAGSGLDASMFPS
ncbi:MAG: molecular chaperone HtpG, partial [Clostridia bacterium]|nr:molecular chaperone HtpG [Clostridia bacterium]